MLEAFVLAEVAKKEGTGFIDRKVDVAAESAANREYLKEASASNNFSNLNLDFVSIPNFFDDAKSNSANEKISETIPSFQLP